MKLQHKVAIVTGGGSGQGRAIAGRFLAEGAQVVIADLNAENAAAVAAPHPEQALPYRVDIRQETDVAAMVSQTVEAFGGLDILVNCAGRLGPVRRTEALSREDWTPVLDVNLFGLWLSMKYALPELRRRGGGSIINIASTAGVRPLAEAAPYCVSKAAVLMLTRTAALEYVQENIRVNAICPGHIDTPMMAAVIAEMSQHDPDAPRKVHTESNPMGRLGQPAEVASVALFLASDESSFMTGAELNVDGGYMLG